MYVLNIIIGDRFDESLSTHRRSIEVQVKVYQGDFQDTLTLARAPRAQAKKIEKRNLGFFPRYLPNYCAEQCLVGL